MRWWKIILIIVACLAAVLFGLFWFIKRPILVATVDEDNLPKFIQANFIDLDKVASISKFRSASGHDFSTHGETCRSMKHYFSPPAKGGYPLDKNGQLVLPPPPDPDTAIPIYSPVDGRIISISEEQTPIGKQFSIRQASHPNYNIRLFHVYPESGIRMGSKVKAGQRIGSIGESQGTDIAVEVTTLKGPQFVSYFQVIPESLFVDYQKRGVKNRSDLVITKEYRDAHPLKCLGNKEEQFAENYQSDPAYDGEVYLNGYSRALIPGHLKKDQPTPGASISPQNNATPPAQSPTSINHSTNSQKPVSATVDQSPSLSPVDIYSGLPSLGYYLDHKTDQFLVDMDVVATGHPFKGRRSLDPHAGAHIHFGDNYKTWPRGGAEPNNYPPIYAAADGIVERVDDKLNVGANDRYGVDIAIAKEGNKIWTLDYSLEPMVPEPTTDFYRQFITVKLGDHVTKGQIIAYMYLPVAANGTHIHFQLTNNASQNFFAPAIFTPGIVQAFHDRWGEFGLDGHQTPIPFCMGWQLAADENPFGTGAVDCLE